MISLLNNCQQVFTRVYPKYDYVAKIVSKLMSKQLSNGYICLEDSSKKSYRKIDKILNIYKELAQNPTLTSTRILSAVNDRITLQTVWSQKNLERRKKQKFIQSFTFDANLQLIAESFPSDITSELLSTQSDDENLKAILREVITEGKSQQFIEIWDKKHLIKSYDLSAFDVHGNVYYDATFSAFNLSPDNNRLLYIAEKKLPKSKPFYTQKGKSENMSDNDELTTRGNEHIFKPDWGEQLVGKHRSVVVILDLKSDTIEIVDSIPDAYFPSQVIWAPNGDIVGVVHKLYPRYLGMMFCTHRESYIFRLQGSEFRILTAKGLSCRSPRFSPDGKYLVWLEREISIPHNHVSRLTSIKWDSTETPEILIDVVKTNKIITNGKQFYGLFNLNLAKRCWCDDSKYLLFSTPCRATRKSYILNLETKEITEIKNLDESSLIILDVRKNIVAFTRSSLTQPPQLVVGKFSSSLEDIGNLCLLKCTTPISNPDLESLIYETTEFVYDNSDCVKDFNFIYLGKKDAPTKSMPVIVIPHGGPHSAFTNDFSLREALFAILGFGVLQINYRGSTGMGGDNIEYILGKIGQSDVLDCITSIDTALKKYPWLDSDKITVYGGSHGGFLSAHLSGQYPDMFKAVVMRNPVIEVATMFSISDIPDWCPGEAGCSDFGRTPETTPIANYPELIQKMLIKSPILHVDKVKAPTLIALGSNDLRVPSSQGKLWYYRLSINNVKTKLYMYDDNHSLSKDETDIDYVINSSLWLIEHTNTEI